MNHVLSIREDVWGQLTLSLSHVLLRVCVSSCHRDWRSLWLSFLVSARVNAGVRILGGVQDLEAGWGAACTNAVGPFGQGYLYRVN